MGTNKNTPNPVTAYRREEFPKQKQAFPGLQKDMQPVPDCGEKSYKGTGRLKGRKALVTGGDSGIGRAAAIAYAREGADVAINYLPVEEADAQEVKRYIEEAGQKAALLPGDLGDEAFCGAMVEQARSALGGLDIMALVAGRQVAAKSIEDITTAQLDEVFRVNVYSLLPLPSSPMTRVSISLTTARARGPSKPLPRPWLNRLRLRVSGLTVSRPVLCGRRCKSAAASSKKLCPNSAMILPWAVRGSP